MLSFRAWEWKSARKTFPLESGMRKIKGKPRWQGSKRSRASLDDWGQKDQGQAEMTGVKKIKGMKRKAYRGWRDSIKGMKRKASRGWREKHPGDEEKASRGWREKHQGDMHEKKKKERADGRCWWLYRGFRSRGFFLVYFQQNMDVSGLRLNSIEARIDMKDQ